MPITKELKERWIARLESPEAKWAGGTLLDTQTGGMCCLGHLADIQGELTQSGRVTALTPDGRKPGADNGVTHEEDMLIYRDEDEIGDACDICLYGLTRDEQENLALANDQDAGFPIELIRKLPEAEA